MKKLRMKRRIIKLFESREGHLESRVEKDYLSSGIATIPCRITDYYDVIRNYSVETFETLNTDFVDYLKTSNEVLPLEYPLVLEIIEDFLSQEQKKIIRETIQEYFAYNLGLVEREEKRHTRIFLGMFFGLLASGVLLWLSQLLEEVPRELFFILFWFMGDTLCDYIFLTGHDLRHNRRTAGRLASIKVIFTNRFVKPDYSNNEINELYSDIEKDVKETLR